MDSEYSHADGPTSSAIVEHIKDQCSSRPRLAPLRSHPTGFFCRDTLPLLYALYDTSILL